MEPVTEAEVRAALEYLFELDPETMVTNPDTGEVERIGDLLSGETVNKLMAEWSEAGDARRQNWGAEAIAIAEEQGYQRGSGGSGMPAWGWVALGALVVGGTWFAVKLAKNGGR